MVLAVCDAVILALKTPLLTLTLKMKRHSLGLVETTQADNGDKHYTCKHTSKAKEKQKQTHIREDYS